MKYTVMIDDKQIKGTAVEILSELKDMSFFDTCNTITEFIVKVQQDIWRLFGIGIQIIHDKTAPDQLMQQLLHHGLLRSVYSRDLK